MKPVNVLLITALLLISGRLYGQDIQDIPLDSVMPMANGKVVYTGTVPVDGVSKNELFSRVTRWFAVVGFARLNDRDAGMLIGQSLFRTPWSFDGIKRKNCSVFYVLSVDVRDGRYSYKVSGLTVDGLRYWRYWGRDSYTIEEFIQRRLHTENSLAYVAAVDLKIKGMLADLEKATHTTKADF